MSIAGKTSAILSARTALFCILDHKSYTIFSLDKSRERHMEVFVGNITSSTTLSDVVHLFKGFAKKARLRMVDKKLENGERAYYAVAEFDSDKLAQKAIKKLNGSILRGQQVVLREFQHRSYNNERRAVNWRDKPWHGPERRLSERRKKLQPQQVDDFDELLQSSRENEQKEKKASVFSISAYSNMARKY